MAAIQEGVVIKNKQKKPIKAFFEYFKVKILTRNR
jgi:hypothetical protein